jgi:FixJ family two-component response regulator
LILDVGLPDLNGLELQQRISGERAAMPIIFMTGRGDIPTSVRAMKAGAVEFLTKPFAPAVLLSAIQSALERSRMCLEEEASLQVHRVRHQALSCREREVMALVVLGQLNKQICGQLGISEITVKQHRGRMMRKMRARSVPELVTIAARLGLETAGNG